MTALQTVNLGTAPAGTDGDTVRVAMTKGNSNVAVLNAQSALTSATTITVAQALTAAAHLGKRVNINLASAGTINVPSASTGGADGVIHLRNVGSTVVTLAITTGSGDTLALTKLNPGESALLDTDGVHAWNVLMRGRTNADNEIVNGTLTVANAVAASHALPLGQAQGRLLGVVPFYASGAFNAPQGTTAVRVKCLGGGGAGGGAIATSVGTVSLGAPGTSGAYAEGYFTSGFNGVAVTVGAAGTYGSGVAGGNGGQSSFGSLLVCPGGYGGSVSGQITGAPTGWWIGRGPAASGAGAYVLSGGVAPSPSLAFAMSWGVGGMGGSSPLGAGGGCVNAGVTGGAAVGFGAGGGGTMQVQSAGAVVGGPATPGVVLVECYGSV
ncbi:hypothetical protein ACFSHT_10435 [Paraburkholderia silviterrae]|uniref:Uncharacterized protein n=1 Tax=Paraburkholderia silviterrae TaxID=2528715 RepID=A0A4R5MFF8_9BURK|nr:hypothetical protein [Paraburkholderia silviterrae]TDG25367.1 hypothetical protein EYW47_05915 [Paraburkholderia silviterrae]